MDRIYIILKIKLTPVLHLSLPEGYIHYIYYGHNRQTSLWVYISQISGECLQDHNSHLVAVPVSFTVVKLVDIIHQSFVTTAPPPTGKGGDYDFLVPVPCYEPHPQGANWRSKLCSLPRT